MALGELISEYRGKITSMKVLPFESGGQGVKYEVTQVADLSGRLTGRGIGSNYVQQAADGTSTTKFYGVFTQDFPALLAQVRCPILMLCGEHDVLMPYFKPACTARPDAKSVLLPGGTYVVDDYPEEVAAAIRVFLDELTA